MMIKDFFYNSLGYGIIIAIFVGAIVKAKYKIDSSEYINQHCHLIETTSKVCHLQKDCLFNSICDTGEETCSWSGKVVCN